MKKLFILIVLTLITVLSFSQNEREGIFKIKNRVKLVKDTVQIGTKYIIDYHDSIGIESPLGTFLVRLDTIIQNTSSGGGVTPISGLLYFNTSTNKYEPYSSSQSFLSFDVSAIEPTITTRLNLNATLHATKYYNGNNTSGYGYESTNTGTGVGYYVENQSTGTGTRITNQSTGLGLSLVNNNSNGYGFYMTNYGRGFYLNQYGTNPMIEINNTSTGSDFKVNTYTNFNSTVANGASAVAYLFDTKNTLSTSGAKIAQFSNNTSNFLYFGVSKISGTGLYTGTTNPDGTGRMNFNMEIRPTSISIIKGTETSSYGGRMFICNNPNNLSTHYTTTNQSSGLFIHNLSNTSTYFVGGLSIQNEGATGNAITVMNYSETGGTGLLITNNTTQLADTTKKGIVINQTSNTRSKAVPFIISLNDTILTRFRPDLNSGSPTAAYDFRTYRNFKDNDRLFSITDSLKEKFKVTEKYTAFASGNSTTFSTVMGRLVTFTGDSTTNGTSETDLYSYTLPSNILAKDGDEIEFKIYIDYTTPPTNVYLKSYFAGNLIGTIVNGVSISGFGTASIIIIRVSSSVCRIFVSGSYPGSIMYNNYIELTAQDFTTTNIIKFTGQCATNSLTAHFGTIDYIPSEPNN